MYASRENDFATNAVLFTRRYYYYYYFIIYETHETRVYSFSFDLWRENSRGCKTRAFGEPPYGLIKLPNKFITSCKEPVFEYFRRILLQCVCVLLSESKNTRCLARVTLSWRYLTQRSIFSGRKIRFDGLRSVNDFVGGVKYSRYDTLMANYQDV